MKIHDLPHNKNNKGWDNYTHLLHHFEHNLKTFLVLLQIMWVKYTGMEDSDLTPYISLVNQETLC